MSNKLSKHSNIDMPNKKDLEELITTYSDEELSAPELEEKIKKLMNIFDYYGIDYNKFTPEHISFLTGKHAYPNYDQYMYVPARHDVKKWMGALKNIVYKQKAGFSYKTAIQNVTSGWPQMEIYDFLNWLKFYQEGTPMKYKYAQLWYENGQPGYFLHMKPDPEPKAEIEPTVDLNAVNEAREQAERSEEKKQTIEKQRQKIIGRLDSAEKLLRSPEGQMFAGDELENLMESIYSLKKKVQLVNKLSVSTRLYEDMIVREANILGRRGFIKAAEMLYSVAQTPGASAQSAVGNQDGGDFAPDGTPPPDPSGAGQSGTMSGLPSTIPGTPSIETPVDGDQNTDLPTLNNIKSPAAPPPTTQSSPAIMPQDEPQPVGIREFIQNMNEGNNTEADELEVSDNEESLIVSEAQAITPPPGPPPAVLEDIPMTDKPAPERRPPAFIPKAIPNESPEKDSKIPDMPEEEPLEVSEDDIPSADEKDAVSNFDVKVNHMFSEVNISDIIAELEDISKAYKTREQPRRLNKVDMMLDGIGLASMFPSLAEAQNKALEANNYISTRVDDILAKLRGALESQKKFQPAPTERPEITGIKTKLQSDQDKEKQRKQMRKEQENAALEGGKKETPVVEMEELAPPVQPTPAG